MILNDIDLRYRITAGWKKIPYWGMYFIRLGYLLMNMKKQNYRTILGITVPTRAYAASLITLGIISASIRPSYKSLNISREYIEFLQSLDYGTPVYYKDKSNSQIEAYFLGFSNTYANNHYKMKIQLAKSKKDILIPIEDVHKLSNRIHKNTKKMRDFNRYWDLYPGGQFVRLLTRQVDPDDFYRKSKLECIILGKIKHLEREINESPFSIISDATGINQAYLQDIIRVKRFTKENQGYRSEIFPLNQNKILLNTINHLPSFAIFDGASGFIRWRDHFNNSNWIIILDRTEWDLSFKEAVGIINQRYIQNRVNEGEIFKDIYPPPAGIELIAFEERR
ncbi:hypothetical protein [Desulforamulus ferrireducens]|uniref:Uncharacterized protein n=1 Tax=Desulforamulus ferrireducens TaxID=1833852 RepID=A0A1S6IXM7_9FIRM|nr:hypothetical protein [Desulforamulus ferrireducens]AQS59528.1 hypothetical protein B0537_10815 [Desulforamulus ferrireducens]